LIQNSAKLNSSPLRGALQASFALRACRTLDTLPYTHFPGDRS